MEIYEYHNADGSLNRLVKKRAGKQFRQYSPSGRPGLSGAQPVIYNLPAVLDAIRRGEEIWIAEGEKDCNSLIDVGLVATTNPQGAGQWLDAHSEFLVGAAAVNIAYDNDKAGIEHALAVAASVERVAEVEAIEFYSAAEGKDVTDHLEAGLSLDELRAGRPEGSRKRTRPRRERAAKGSPGALQLPAVFQLAMLRLTNYAKKNNLPQPRMTGEPEDHSFEVCCPAHDDRSPSLGIRVGDKQPIVVNCQAGCSLTDIALALNINAKEFSAVQEGDDPVEKRLAWLRADQSAREILLNESMSQFELENFTWDEYLAAEDGEVEYTIESLHPKGSNSLLVANAKSGKTTMLINLQRSLSMGSPFAEHFETRELEGKIAYLEFEMIGKMFKTWILTNGVPRLQNIMPPQHLRGRASPFATQAGRNRLVNWLGENSIEVLIIDPIARAWQGIVDNENDNSQVARFTHLLDEVKYEAGVTDLIVATHTGRTIYAQDDEHARGATRLEDWADSLWYYMKDEKTGKRSLRAIGRSVDLSPTFIDYVPETMEIFTSGALRTAHHDDIYVQDLIDHLAEFEEGFDEITTAMLKGEMSATGKDASRIIHLAIERGYIERREGPKRAQFHHLTEAGRQLHARQITYDKD